MNKYAMRIPSSSLVYQLQRKSVIDGNKQPSKKPRKIRVVTSPAKFCTKPVQRQTRPQKKVIVGMTRLKDRRLTSSDVGNFVLISDCTKKYHGWTHLCQNVEDVKHGYGSLLSISITSCNPLKMGITRI
jgi:hypothetical protein